MRRTSFAFFIMILIALGLVFLTISITMPDTSVSGFDTLFLTMFFLGLGTSGIVGGPMYYLWHKKRIETYKLKNLKQEKTLQRKQYYFKQKKSLDQMLNTTRYLSNIEDIAPCIVEEEDKKIKKSPYMCVIHKGPIKGVSFVCPYCRAMYCDECAKKLMISKERCCSCNHEMRVYISQGLEPDSHMKSTEQIIEDIINSHPIIKKFINSDKNLEEMLEIENYYFSLLREEDLKNLDILSLPANEKRRFIEELLWLGVLDRDLLFLEMSEKQYKKRDDGKFDQE